MLTGGLPEWTLVTLLFYRSAINALYGGTRKASSFHCQTCIVQLKTCIFALYGPVHTDTTINMRETVTRQFTLSIPSARQHCDSFPRSRQVLKEDLLAVWLRHFHSGSVYIPVHFDKVIKRGPQQHKKCAKMMKGNSRPPPLPMYARSALLLPVPHRRFAWTGSGRVIDITMGQPDPGSIGSPLILNQWEGT